MPRRCGWRTARTTGHRRLNGLSRTWSNPRLGQAPGVIGCGTGIPPGQATSYWLFRKGAEPAGGFAFYRGCDGASTDAPCNLGDAPAYAHWVKKQIPIGEDPVDVVDVVDVVDLVYFFYYPYNFGKLVAGSVWGVTPATGSM